MDRCDVLLSVFAYQKNDMKYDMKTQGCSTHYTENTNAGFPHIF